MGNLVLYPHMCNFAYGDRRMHMGIPVCKRAGIAEKFAYGDPITHNEIVRIWGLTYTQSWIYVFCARHHICIPASCQYAIFQMSVNFVFRLL